MSDKKAGARPTEIDPALRQRFLHGMSHAVCTVNVVTTDGVAGRHGVTVSAMVSVSADTPQPTLLVCIHHRSAVADALLETAFSASMSCATNRRIFQIILPAAVLLAAPRSSTAPSGPPAPRVVDALVAFDCRVTASERVGSHFVVFGSVQDIHVAGPGAPLIYANRACGVPRRFHQRRTARSAAAKPALTLGCYQVFAPFVVPALVARLSKLHPGITLTLLEADQQHLIASLRRNDVEVALLDLEPSREYFLSLFRKHGLEPTIGFRSKSLEMVRGLVGHGLGYSILATKPANNMTYDGRALVARPLSVAASNSRLVLRPWPAAA